MAFDVNITNTVNCTDSTGKAVFTESLVTTVQLENYIYSDLPLATAASDLAVASLGDLTSKDFLIIIPGGDITIKLIAAGTDIEIPNGFIFTIQKHTTEFDTLLLTNDSGGDITVKIIAGDKS